MRYEFGGLIFGGAYTRRGLFSELLYVMSLPGVFTTPFIYWFVGWYLCKRKRDI